MNTVESLSEIMGELEGRIKYSFKNKKNLLLALTHSSYANENKNKKLQCNERLEFLGDAILNVVVSESMYLKHAELAEGDMTKVRASIVCESSLMRCSNSIELGSYLLLGKGEEITGGRERSSILSDAFEALIGAIYIDGGMKNAKAFILGYMESMIENAVNGAVLMDYKTQLQETVQKHAEKKVSYEVVEEKGPDHNKIFVTQVKVAGRVMGTGSGKSKKEAEQNAAKCALAKVGE